MLDRRRLRKLARIGAGKTKIKLRERDHGKIISWRS